MLEEAFPNMFKDDSLVNIVTVVADDIPFGIFEKKFVFAAIHKHVICIWCIFSVLFGDMDLNLPISGFCSTMGH